MAYAAFKIRQRDPEACIMVVGSDYLIRNVPNFLKDAALGLDRARLEPSIMTLGIRPTPATGYGYIQYIDPGKPQPYYKVKMFTESPTARWPRPSCAAATSSGTVAWSCFRSRRSSPHLPSTCPDLHEIFQNIATDLDTEREPAAIREAYEKCRNESIDLGIMEKAKNVFVIPSSFDWSDLGTWGSVYEQMEQDYVGNAVVGNVMAFDSANNLVNISDPKKLVVLHGISSDCIVVDTGDVISSAKWKMSSKSAQSSAKSRKNSAINFHN